MNCESALDGWLDWGLELQQRPRLLGPVPGGLTNRNYRLAAPGHGQDLLLRINRPDSQRLGIDRRVERRILAEVAQQGIGRPALYWDPADRYTVFPWLEARPWTAADFAGAAQRQRLRPLLQQLHSLKLDLPRRDYHAYLNHYWQQFLRADRANERLQQQWLDFEPRLCDFAGSDWPAHLVHHDLVPANLLDTGERLVLIDWEYAAIGHAGIDIWSVTPEKCSEPFIAELMGWINALWGRLIKG